MGTFVSLSSATYQYYNFGGFLDWWRVGAPNDANINVNEIVTNDDLLVPGEDVQVIPGGATFDYIGTYSYTNGGGTTFNFIVLRDQFTSGTSGQYYLYSLDDTPPAEYPFGFDPNLVVSENTVICFAPGTGIATPQGDKPVEELNIGDSILTAGGRQVVTRWIGRQTVHKAFAGERACPVRIRASALGRGRPHADLVLTADHALILDGLAINAGALVNGSTIAYDPVESLPDRVTYYHVETEDHDVILANGVPVETYVDYVQRAIFDNHAEYLALYGNGQTIPEMPLPRISTGRLVPEAIKARLASSDAA